MIESVVAGLIVGFIIVFVGWFLVVKTARYQIRHFKKALKDEGVMPDLEQLAKRFEARVDDKIQHILSNDIPHMADEFIPKISEGIKEAIQGSLGSIAGQAKQILSVESRVTKKQAKQAAVETLKGMVEQKYPGAGMVVDQIAKQAPQVFDMALENPQAAMMLIDKFLGSKMGGQGQVQGGGNIPTW